VAEEGCLNKQSPKCLIRDSYHVKKLSHRKRFVSVFPQVNSTMRQKDTSPSYNNNNNNNIYIGDPTERTHTETKLLEIVVVLSQCLKSGITAGQRLASVRNVRYKNEIRKSYLSQSCETRHMRRNRLCRNVCNPDVSQEWPPGSEEDRPTGKKES
jgi:hypothetical protein